MSESNETFTVGVLLCDHVAKPFRDAAGGDYDEVYHRFLTEVGIAKDSVSNDDAVGNLGQAAFDTVAFDTVAFDCVNGELPASPQQCDGWIITGSKHDAHSSEEWVLQLAAFVRDVVAHNRPLVGICFGHQLVGLALGGTLTPGTSLLVGPKSTTIDSTPWSIKRELSLNAMHQDSVSKLPPGAVRIATGETAAHGGFRIDEHVLCFQDHPEFTNAYTQCLMFDRSHRIEPNEMARALNRHETVTVEGNVVASDIRAFFSHQRQKH